MTVADAIPGAKELVGKGVYRGVPANVPYPVRDRHAVVVGKPAECAAAARRVADAGWTVTVAAPQRCCGSSVVCAAGIEYLEAVVLRRVGSGRIEACNASALFILER